VQPPNVMRIDTPNRAVCLDIDGPYSGEYVVRCATGDVKYFGERYSQWVRATQHLTMWNFRSPLGENYDRMGLHLRNMVSDVRLNQGTCIMVLILRLPASSHVPRFFPST